MIARFHKSIGHETENAANAAGFRYFTDAERFRDYVRQDVLMLKETTA